MKQEQMYRLLDQLMYEVKSDSYALTNGISTELSAESIGLDSTSKTSTQESASPSTTSSDYPLTLEELYFSKAPDPSLSMLFPPIEPSYFKDKGEVFKKESNNPLDWYESLKIKPYIQSKDLNNSGDEPHVNKPKPAWDIGIKFDV